MVQIDKHIPFPLLRQGKTKHPYPWHELEIGESFVYEGDIINAQSAALYYTNRCRQDHKVFKARTLNGHVRVWRVE